MTEPIDTILQVLHTSFHVVIPVLISGFAFSQCGKKPAAAPAGGAAVPKAGGESKSSKEGDKPVGGEGPKAPADKDAVAGTHDPNYQTLAGVDGNVFQEKGKPAAGGATPTPKPGGPGMAATHDPNYQTLAGIGNDCFDKKK
ncbi:hypothetical protein GCK72_002133 [Caenorhabditis remanei]|uniref:Uncharacterized protein n=1 Tax=Caenorhabditis remanei TaxID=31234 RepID=A0A6A5HRY0_CAERE|nr:hypothetical protein GCK72_002133 [Caenorhabditis remanei]KAF1770315.1 hypothetical protein GCK72_002133 [Caenorhabditis remanei]